MVGSEYFLHWGSLSKFHSRFLGKCGSTQVVGCMPVRTHNRFLCRNWWHGITPLVERSQVTTHIHYVLGWPDGRRRVMVTATTAFIPNIDVVISYRQVKSHPLVMSCNTARAGQLWEKSVQSQDINCTKWVFKNPLCLVTGLRPQVTAHNLVTPVPRFYGITHRLSRP
jgi:hypothetical protein